MKMQVFVPGLNQSLREEKNQTCIQFENSPILQGVALPS